MSPMAGAPRSSMDLTLGSSRGGGGHARLTRTSTANQKTAVPLRNGRRSWPMARPNGGAQRLMARARSIARGRGQRGPRGPWDHQEHDGGVAKAWGCQRQRNQWLPASRTASLSALIGTSRGDSFDGEEGASEAELRGPTMRHEAVSSDGTWRWPELGFWVERKTKGKGREVSTRVSLQRREAFIGRRWSAATISADGREAVDRSASIVPTSCFMSRGRRQRRFSRTPPSFAGFVGNFKTEMFLHDLVIQMESKNYEIWRGSLED
jgi:hypothetical protein